MAKKKKSSKKKVAAPPPKEPSVFWPLAGAFILILLALFLLLGGFGTGGTLPKGMYHGAYATFGWAAALTPFALAYWGIYKLRSDERRLPVAKLSSVVCTLVFAAAFFGTMFAHVAADDAGGKAVTGVHGGAIGNAFAQGVLGMLDKLPASLLFLLLTLLAICFALGASPKVLLRPFEHSFRRRERPEGEEITDLAQLKAKATGGFKLNEGVPVEHHSEEPAKEPVKLASFRNTAQKLTPSENHAALTAASDPDWQFPSLTRLNQKQDKADPGNVEHNARLIHDTYANFNIDVEMEGANVGPRITQYTMKPPTGVKLQKITALENNLALDLAATSIRMEAPIPGKRAVGIEVPNVKPATVRLSALLTSKQWSDISGPLGFAIGRDISGTPVVADLAKMPHLLVAGQTGSGKSVMINTILTSLLYRNSPADLKLIMVDPKFVELGTYNDIPHLLTPVITEPEKVISALKWAVAEMERRLRTMAEINTSNIAEYNAAKKEEGMPYIVIVIDELADLMMMAARDVEALIVRIAQKARAAGIHLILATQRPSVNVITGLIKANVPARIAFTVASQVDSRTIIDGVGAEKLLGMGDMLFYTTDMAKPKRVQGALIEKGEVVKVTDFVKQQRAAEYNDEVVSQPVQLDGKGGVVADMSAGGDADDDMFRDAVRVVIEGHKASTSLLQRRLRIGYGRAARLIEEMEEQGIIGAADGSRPREVLVSSLDQVFGGGEAAPSDEPAEQLIQG
ncbi:MAG TPA: DNA translocase FtsK 4TM domain-containing protein [Candidatus Saccharimonadales bacterium]|nr:DNA translocase FtsK 4TM domain-containing protein [Candidatus Saccharimonadales bacterium]